MKILSRAKWLRGSLSSVTSFLAVYIVDCFRYTCFCIFRKLKEDMRSLSFWSLMGLVWMVKSKRQIFKVFLSHILAWSMNLPLLRLSLTYLHSLLSIWWPKWVHWCHVHLINFLVSFVIMQTIHFFPSLATMFWCVFESFCSLFMFSYVSYVLSKDDWILWFWVL